MVRLVAADVRKKGGFNKGAMPPLLLERSRSADQCYRGSSRRRKMARCRPVLKALYCPLVPRKSEWPQLRSLPSSVESFQDAIECGDVAAELLKFCVGGLLRTCDGSLVRRRSSLMHRAGHPSLSISPLSTFFPPKSFYKPHNKKKGHEAQSQTSTRKS
jgi:hypothetical protein